MPGKDSSQGILATLNTVVKTYHLFEARLDELDKDMDRVLGELGALRIEHMDLLARVARLEESRATLKAEVAQEVTQTVAELRVRFAEQDAERRVTYERALMEAKNQLKSE